MFSKSRTARSAAAAVAAVGLVLASAPAATASATVVREFYVDYGASYATGTATFSNRWVTLKGTLHAVGCGRRVIGHSYAGPNYLGSASSTPRCDGNWPFDVPVPADVPGGADEVWIVLDAPDGSDSTWAYR